MSEPVPIDVVIAARNEAATIRGTLEALARQRGVPRFRVVVSCNDCRDETAEIARRVAHELASGACAIEVVERSEPGKTGALNAAERALGRAAVRVFLDADVRLSDNALAQLAGAVAGDAPRVASPRKVVVGSGSWLVDGCARCWLALPWVQDDVLGGGALAVNAAGRARWGEFPDVTADDTFLVFQFAPHERVVVPSCTTGVRFPRRLAAMLRAQHRWVEGERQLQALPTPPPYGPGWSSRRRLRAMLDPRVLAAALVVRLQRWLAKLFGSGAVGSSWTQSR